MREEIFQKLKGMAEENYKAFNCKLIPGVNEDRTLGVRVPDMRKLAAQVSRGNWKTYLLQLEHCAQEPQGVGAVLGAMEKVHHEDYYVKMAVAWNLSVCYVKFPEKTEILLTEERLDVFTHNKTIQKIRESLRVPREDKERLKALKRSDGEPKQS